MSDSDLVTAGDVRLMQGLAQRVTATRHELVNSDATFGELAWIWGKDHASDGDTWRRRLWFSTIMWLDEANQTAEFEPVGTHPAFRRLGLGSAMLRHGMHLARDAGATHMTVACLGAPGHPQARALYYGVGFRPFTRDAPLIKPAV
jgi:GNAT superfamily N-acetyltransferase